MDTFFSVASVMSLVDQISGPLRGIYDKLTSFEKKVNSTSNSLGAFTKKLLPVALAAGIVGGALVSTALATIPTEKALGELASVGITDFAALETSAASFSNAWSGTNKADFLTAAYDIKSGISSLSDAGVAKFTELSALTAKATKASVGEMTSLFATGYGIYKGFYANLSDMQFGELFSSGIAASVQAFKTDGSKMSQAISTLGATATNSNVPLQEQLAILGTLQATMPGAEAGTKYKAFLNAAAGAGKKLGLSFLDANGQLLSTPALLDKLKGKFGPTINAMEKLKIKQAFGTDEAVAFIDLLYQKTGDLTGGIATVAQAMQQGAGFTGSMAEKMNTGLGPAMKKAGQQFDNLVEGVGKVFAPALQALFQAMSPVLLTLQAWVATPLGKTILAATAVLAGLIVTVFTFTAVMWAATLAAGMLGSVMAVVFSPITLILLAVGAAIFLVMQYWEDLRVVWLTVSAAVSAGLGRIKADFIQVVQWVRSGIDWLAKGASNLYDSGVKLIDSFVEGIKSRIMAPVEVLKAGLGKLRELLSFSDAKAGPLSDLTLSGRRIMDTLGAGAKAAAPNLAAVASKALAGVAAAATLTVATPVLPPAALAMPAALPTMSSPAAMTMPIAPTPVSAPGGMALPALAAPVLPQAGLTLPPAVLPRPAPQVIPPASRLESALATPQAPALSMPPEPRLGSASATPPDPRQEANPASRAATGDRRVVISGLTVHLPGVNNADGFLRELQRLVEQHDGDPL